LVPAEPFLTYQSQGLSSEGEKHEQGDKLIWDQEYFEDDPIIDEQIIDLRIFDK
jgi:hypothetical protein